MAQGVRQPLRCSRSQLEFLAEFLLERFENLLVGFAEVLGGVATNDEVECIEERLIDWVFGQGLAFTFQSKLRGCPRGVSETVFSIFS